MFRVFTRRAARGARAAADRAWVAIPLAAGFALAVLLVERWGSVRLLGGFAPGRAVAAALALAGAALVLRHAAPPRAVVRRRGGGAAARVAGRVAFPLRAALIGALIAVVALRSFHPVRADRADVVVHIADKQNDMKFAGDLLDRCVQVRAENPDRTVEFGTVELGRLVDEARAGRLRGDDPRWWDELKRQPPTAERLAALRDRYADQFGQKVYVVSVEPPTDRVQPWPVLSDRVTCRWLCADPSRVPRADRTQLLSYCVHQDACAAPYLYATLAIKPGDPVPAMVVAVTGADPVRVEPSGRFGDHRTYRAAVPRDRAIEAVRFEVNGAPMGIDALTDLKLAPRQLKVHLGPGLEALAALPWLADQTGGPVKFVTGGADVEWGTDPEPKTGLPYVEFLIGTESYASAPHGYRLARTPAGVACPVGSVALPKAGSEFRHFARSAPVDTAWVRLIDLAREPEQPVPLVFHRNAGARGRVTVVAPPVADVAKLEGNVPQAFGKVLVWATSLAWRDGKTDPPVKLWKLDAPGADAPAESGPPEVTTPVRRQLVSGLAGRLDGNTYLAAGNSIRAELRAWALALLGAILALTACGAVTARLARPAE